MRKPQQSRIMHNMLKRQAGQGMTEYIIIVALIAIAAIGVFMFFGNTARQQVAGMATELSGRDANEQRQNAADQADLAVDQADKDSGLGQYGGNNQGGGGGGP